MDDSVGPRLIQPFYLYIAIDTFTFSFANCITNSTRIRNKMFAYIYVNLSMEQTNNNHRQMFDSNMFVQKKKKKKLIYH